MDHRFPHALPERFTSKITVDEQTGCWLWTARLDRDGYAHFRDGKRVVHGHRYAYQIVNGVTLAPKQCACHECDVRSCVNPEHVFIDDHAGNMRDMRRKGRGRCRLTLREVWQLRVAHHRCGATLTELAQLFRMRPSDMDDVLQCRRYKVVPDPRECLPGYVPPFDVTGRLLRDDATGGLSSAVRRPSPWPGRTPCTR